MSQQPSASSTSMESAREFIEEIARCKGTYTESFRQQAEEEAKQGRKGMLQAMQGAEEIREDLSKTLKIISDDLYANKARFLMEVIQNADDNQYENLVTPTLYVTVFPQFVKIECNETGFTKDNVQALCRVGRSSKPIDKGYTGEKGIGKGYIGEKGIGFKSVFKVAKRAHIRSPPYYFQLDQDRELGMITPQWDQEYFAVHPRNHQTTIILDRIREASNFSTALEADVKAIHPMIILFLRRIKRLHVILYPSSSLQTGATVSKRFLRHDDDASCPGITSLEDEDLRSKEYFYQLTYTSTFKGIEERRRGVSCTDIILAFPVQLHSNKWTPKPTQLPTFAYLPLGYFDFKFIIQADFLTTSNRQSVDEDNSWNINIAENIPKAFVNAVCTFNEIFPNSEQLGKTWPLFLNEISNASSQYWRKIKSEILQRLQETSIIQTQSGSYEYPSALTFMDWAHDRNGKLMFGSSTEYVSLAYPNSVRPYLALLGVNSPDWKWVSQKLQNLHQSRSLHGGNRTMEWYSDLAKVIFSPNEAGGNKRYAVEIGSIPLIPLADGEWSTAPTTSNPIYFPHSLGTTIPSGLPLTVVDRDACKCPHRMKLFKWLGVKDCDVKNVVERIVDYHTKFENAQIFDIIEQVKYLYQVKEHLRTDDMKKVYFAIQNGGYFRKGLECYADDSTEAELCDLFSGYDNAFFLDSDYFQGLSHSKKRDFVKWLASSADVATRPRFQSQFGSLHDDFLWLLQNRSDHILGILYKHWNDYASYITDEIKNQLANHRVLCQSGDEVPLRQTFIPFSHLVEISQEFCGANSCPFVVLPDGQTREWMFLSQFDVGIAENLEFYLWILRQPRFKTTSDVEKAKKLYLEIQSWACYDVDQVRNAFRQDVIALPSGNFVSTNHCVYRAPPGFSAKSSLFSIYGGDLSDLFQRFLKVKNASTDEVLVYLEQLKSNSSTTISSVLGVYKYLQDYCLNTCNIQPSSYCIAVPSISGSLEWKMPSQCVWDDQEFSQNGLQLQSKVAMRRIIEQHVPLTTTFFMSILKLKNAGIDELLDDLRILQRNESDNSMTIFRLYERIETYRRSSLEKIKNAFRTKPLIFVRGYSGSRGKWLRLNQCVWSRSILRSKHALMPTLNQYRTLFRDTLEVPNVTIEMLVTELINTSLSELNGDTFQYCKDILLDISRMRETNNALQPLNSAKCWPCREPSGQPTLCTIGDFYVNDRQNLFDIFSTSRTFLDFDFDQSRMISDLLRSRGCVSFLSSKVTVRTLAHEPLEIDKELTEDYGNRADALKKYFEHKECRSPYELGLLLKRIKVRTSPNIETQYHIPGRSFPLGTTVTRDEGGSCVKVNTTRSTEPPTLEIYLSSDKSKRECALVTDFPNQLVEALKIEPVDITAELHQFLQVPLESLNVLLVKKGIVGGISSSSNNAETPIVNRTVGNERTHEEQLQNHGIPSLSTTFDELPRSLGRTTETTIISSQQSSIQTLNSRVPVSRNLFGSSIESNSQSTSSEESVEVPTVESHVSAGTYSTTNRNRNINRIRHFALNPHPVSSAQTQILRPTSNNRGAIFDLTELTSALQQVQSVHVRDSTSRRARSIPDRNPAEKARDFEVGFLGECFIFSLLHDALNLPNFSGEQNWTSSLRSRALFSTCSCKVSDFTYNDNLGVLTHHFQQMSHPYVKPDWLNTVCRKGNKPLYRLEVKATTSQDATTPFYMSGNQYELAKRLQVTTNTPSEIYVILRVSGLNALEEGTHHEPEWRAYLDPYSLGQEGILNFFAPTYAVTAAR